jgi:hypothetical protein
MNLLNSFEATLVMCGKSEKLEDAREIEWS